uniref:NIDO domain-containing protein n=1 Tax=Ascaris lumbricoides TaxID=6252 RepID=A0A0M3HS06_ASCLU
MLPHRAFVLLSLLSLALATQLYRYGTDEGDQEIEFSSEPSAMSLDVPIIYFEETQNEIFISSNGLLSFGRPVSGSGIKDLDTERLSAIAVFYVPTSGGTIYYRATSSDNDLLNDLTDRIRRNFPRRDSTEFRALHAILVTWDAMTASDAKGVNEYQLALVTDGLSSYAVFLYNRIDWTTSDGRIAQAGLYYSDGRRQSMVNSGTVNIKELVNLSNNQKEGSYIFRISGSSPEDPRGSVEDDYTYNDYEPEYDPDENVRRPQHAADNCYLEGYMRPNCEFLELDLPLTAVDITAFIIKVIRQELALSAVPAADCPSDPYRYECPSECQFLGKMTEKLEQKFVQALRLEGHDRLSVCVFDFISSVLHFFYYAILFLFFSFFFCFN